MTWVFTLFVLTGFILWDPFHFWSRCPQKNRMMGLLFITGGVLGGISMATHFPLWLWALPAGLAALPYGIPPLKIHQRKLLTAAAVLSVLYLAIVGYRIFSHFGGDGRAGLEPAPPTIIVDVEQQIKALEAELALKNQKITEQTQTIEELKKLVNRL